MNHRTTTTLFLLTLLSLPTEANGQTIYNRNTKAFQQRVQFHPNRSTDSNQKHWNLNNGKTIRHFVQPPQNKKHKKRSAFIDPFLALRLQRELAVQRAILAQKQRNLPFTAPLSRSNGSYRQSFGNNANENPIASNPIFDKQGRIINLAGQTKQAPSLTHSKKQPKSQRIRSPFANFSDRSESVLEAIRQRPATSVESSAQYDR